MRWPEGMFLIFEEPTCDAELVVDRAGARYVTPVRIFLVNGDARVQANPYLIPGWDDQQWWPAPPPSRMPPGCRPFLFAGEICSTL